MLAIYTHTDCLQHDTGPGHPECIERLTEILAALKNSTLYEPHVYIDAPLGTDGQILLAHTAAYLASIKSAAPSFQSRYLDGDTVMSPGTLQAALRAVGAGCAAVDALMKGTYSSAFCAIRPPGHHATKNRAMGFCLFNNIAIAACYALETHKLKRVAIVDFDVHHGNGTQDIMENERCVLYISTHQSPLFPGTGRPEEKGVGNILNLPLPAGTDGAHYRDIFTHKVLPALNAFKPELVLVSAGFDAHRDDPLAGLKLVEDDYGWIGEQLRAVAHQHCGGKIISFLEGGYNLDVLGRSVAAYLGGIV